MTLALNKELAEGAVVLLPTFSDNGLIGGHFR